MKVAKEKLKTTKHKVYLVFWILYWCVTAYYFFGHIKQALIDSEYGINPTSIAETAAVIAVFVFSIIFCFHRWGNNYKRLTPEGKEYKPRIKWYHFGFLILTDLYCFAAIELINNTPKLIVEMNKLYVAMNLLGGLIMGLILFFWYNSIRRACMTLLIFATTMSLIFYFVYASKGEPLQLIDIFNFKTAWGVAGAYEFVFTKWVTMILCLSLSLIAVILHCPDRSLAKKKPGKILMRVGVFGFMIFGYWFYLYTPWNSNLGIVTDLWAPHDTYEEVGTNMGFFCVAKFMKNDPPKGYSISKVKEIANRTVEEYKTWDGAPEPDGVTPVNIIAIMNESFADYRRVDPDLKTNVPYMPYYDSMNENVVKGFTQVCIWGGGTSKSEYEFLTGNSVRQYPGVVPFVNFYTHDQYSMVSTLKDQGYTAYAIHPNKGTNWNRTTAYQYLGFDRFFTIDDFPEDLEKVHNLPSDMEDYRFLIDLVNQKENPDDPLFIFDVTMQNHGGYSANNYKTDVEMIGLSDEAVSRYLSLVKNTDEATKYLIEYFKTVDEPTMIIFFGDHYPGLEQTEEFLSGAVRDELKIKDREAYFETPFFIWTNYDSETVTGIHTSCSFLGTLALQKTGLELTPFNHYQQMYMETIKGYNNLGYYDSESTFHAWKKAPQEILDLRLEYEYLQYNALVEKMNRVDWFYKIQGE